MHEVTAKGILSAHNGMNLYRGCTHGCIYCDSRSRCYQINHEFTDIEVKVNAPELLEEALRKKRKKCMIGTGSMCDSYIPLELERCNTRKCLELIDHYGFGVAIQTKSNRILRDLNLLQHINEQTKCVVQITLTTFDEDLCHIIEPNVSSTKERIEVLNIMKDHKIPTIVWFSPFLPFLNDTEENIRGLLDACINANVYGILCFGIGLTLREGNREYFYQQLDKHFPGLKERYIKTYGNAYEIVSPNHNQLFPLFHQICEKHHILHDNDAIFNYIRTFETKQYEQLTLPF